MISLISLLVQAKLQTVRPWWVYMCDSRVENGDDKIETYQSTWYDHRGRLNTITVSANTRAKNKYGSDNIHMPGLTARLR